MNTNRKRLLIINSILFLVYMASILVMVSFELGNFINLLAIVFYTVLQGLSLSLCSI